MRVPFCCVLLVLSALGMAVGQDTNFATGPQYLLTGSPLFARPISTPSYSLSGPPLEIGATTATDSLIAGAGNQTVVPPSPDALPFVDFFSIYYGGPPVTVIEVSFPEGTSESSLPENLPASILDTGVWQITSAQALRTRGYGVTLAEAAQYNKSLTRRAPHVYTNADIDRLHRGM